MPCRTAVPPSVSEWTDAKGIPMRGRNGGLAAAVLLAVVAASGCADGGTQAGVASSSGAGAASGVIMVMAPVPLKGALDKVKAAFERAYGDLTVTVNYGHVPALLTQISQGVPADVLVTPDEATMSRVQAKGVIGPSRVAMARNTLALVVPAANPAHVTDVTALGETKLTVAVCAADLPCGTLTSQLAAKAGVTLAADSQEPGGSPAVVTKAAAGEIDVGVCFATDAKAAAGRVTLVALPDALGTSATVTAARVKAPANTGGANQFLAFLSSAAGRALFTAAGFAAL